MEGEEEVVVKGWTLDPREVRQIASRMGIPANVPVPRVIVTAEETGTHLGESGSDPSGYWISISESTLAKREGLEYTLGPEARDDVKHELAHMMEHIERGTRPGRAETPEEQARREINAELRGETRLATSQYLSYLMTKLLQDYDDLSVKQTIKIVKEAALRRGVPRRVVSRAENLVHDYLETQ